jgi:hypothetical protein
VDCGSLRNFRLVACSIGQLTPSALNRDAFIGTNTAMGAGLARDCASKRYIAGEPTAPCECGTG